MTKIDNRRAIAEKLEQALAAAHRRPEPETPFPPDWRADLMRRLRQQPGAGTMPEALKAGSPWGWVFLPGAALVSVAAVALLVYFQAGNGLESDLVRLALDDSTGLLSLTTWVF